MIASFVAALVVLDGLLARLATGDAGLCSIVYKGFAEPISVIPSISEEPFSLRQAIHQGGCASIITDLACRDEEADWSSFGVCDRVQFSIHTTLGQTD